MKKIVFLFLILNSPFLIAQTQFQWTIGGTDNDIANKIIKTTDGGYALVGETYSFGAGIKDFYLVKLDASGTIQWSRTVGGASFESAVSIIQTTDGGYAVAGYTESFGGVREMYIVKLDATGTLQWSKTVGGTGIEFAHAIIQTTDGGFVVAGECNSFGAGGYDMFIVKLDNNGTVQWSKTVGGTDNDLCFSIIQTTDGGYAAAGSTNSFGAGNRDMYIVKLDGSGTVQWSRTFGGTNNDYCNSIIQTPDGGYAVGGQFGIWNDDMCILKLDGSGTVQWSRFVGGTNYDIAFSMIQTTDGGYVLAGQASSFGAGQNDMYIVKLDGSGTVQWSRTAGGTGIDYATSIIQNTDGSYIAAGWTLSFGIGARGMYIVKIDPSGNICENSSSPVSTINSGGTTTSPTSTVTAPTPTVTTPTPTTSTGGTVTTICTFVGVQPISNEIPSDFELYQNYPNPFNPGTKIQFSLPKSSFAKIVVYDVLGRELETLLSEQLNAGTYEAYWNADKFSSGVYFYKLVTNDYVETKKMLLVK